MAALSAWDSGRTPAGLADRKIFYSFVVNMLDGVLLRYSANPLIFIGSALFTILTVYISCIQAPPDGGKGITYRSRSVYRTKQEKEE